MPLGISEAGRARGLGAAGYMADTIPAGNYLEGARATSSSTGGAATPDPVATTASCQPPATQRAAGLLSRDAGEVQRHLVGQALARHAMSGRLALLRVRRPLQ